MAMEQIGMTVTGVKVFDPRDSTMKWTDNPALIMRDLMRRLGASSLIDEGVICEVADHCDAEGMEMSAFIFTKRNGTAETYSKIPRA